MKIIIILFILFILIVSPFARMFVKNIHYEYFYSLKDIFEYFRYKKWEHFNGSGITLFIGMFGHGKTLCMTHKARLIYKQFGNKVRFFSNYELKNIPYTPLINFQQLVEIGEEEKREDLEGTVVLIDEIENVLSHRNYANFPLELLSTITQQRKLKVQIFCSAQRYFMVDRIWRGITTYVVDCNKIWRWQNIKFYDAWDYENAGANAVILKPKINQWWFVRNIDYQSYNTESMISKSSAEDFISNDESIKRKGLDASVQADAIRTRHLKKMYRKQRK